MASKTKLKKNANILDELQAIVLKQADAQATVIGEPGKDTKPSSPEPSTEHIDKNKVKPENNKNEFSQDPSKEEAGKVVSAGGVKSASTTEEPSKLEKLSTELLELLKKAEGTGEASVKGKDDTKPSSPEPSTEHIDKNKVVPEDNTNKMVQDPSKEDAGKAISAAKVAEDVTAAKIASYNLGINLVRDLLKEANYGPVSSEPETQALLKQAGSRDFENIINQAAAALQKESATAPEKKTKGSVKQAMAELSKEAEVQPVDPRILEKEAAEHEAAGAALFNDVYKEASLVALASQNEDLTKELEKISASVEELRQEKIAESKANQEKLEKAARLEEIQAAVNAAVNTLMPKVAETVVNQLKSESTSSK